MTDLVAMKAAARTAAWATEGADCAVKTPGLRI